MKSQVNGSKNSKEKSLRPNAGTEAWLSGLLTAVAGGFAVTLVRNETQRHCAALKNAGHKIQLLIAKRNRVGWLSHEFFRDRRGNQRAVRFYPS